MPGRPGESLQKHFLNPDHGRTTPAEPLGGGGRSIGMIRERTAATPPLGPMGGGALAHQGRGSMRQSSGGEGPEGRAGAHGDGTLAG